MTSAFGLSLLVSLETKISKIEPWNPGSRNSQYSFLFESGETQKQSLRKRQQNPRPQPPAPATSPCPWAGWLLAGNGGTHTLKQMSTHLFHSSTPKPARETAGSSMRGAPWDPSASEEKEGSPWGAQQLLEDATAERGQCQAELTLPTSYASGTRWLPVSLGLFLPESWGLLISFQALNHFAVPKKSESSAQTNKAGKVAQQAQPWAEMTPLPPLPASANSAC